MKRLKHKYNAQKTEVDSIKFDSKAEARYFSKLKALQEAGDVLFFLRQVPFYLPGGVRYVIDFVEFWAPSKDGEPGHIRWVDVKGFETESFKAKKKMVEALYPLTIEIEK